MIVPCIDLMGGKVVQLVQGREKALEAEGPLEMLQRFSAFPQIQVIDLDAAIGSGSNDALVELVASKAITRIGGGVRSVERARKLMEQGAYRVIIGTSAFTDAGVDTKFLGDVGDCIGKDRIVVALDSKGGKIAVKGWRQSLDFTAGEVIQQLEPYCGGFLCTYVDKEGMMQGTDLDWFRSLRAATEHEITAAGGITTIEDIRQLHALDIDAAVGMAIYTGRLDLGELAALNLS
jgi:phosphoribosylformimino-5-aminoimidazole carboxamide ribotide isomerase